MRHEQEIWNRKRKYLSISKSYNIPVIQAESLFFFSRDGSNFTQINKVTQLCKNFIPPICNTNQQIKQKPTLFTMESSIMSDRNLNPVMEPNFCAYSCNNIVTGMSKWSLGSHHFSLPKGGDRVASCPPLLCLPCSYCHTCR